MAKLFQSGVARRRRYALLAGCAIASLTAGLSLQPREARAVICDSVGAPAGPAGSDFGNPSNTACFCRRSGRAHQSSARVACTATGRSAPFRP
jgi:hypothetical protein